MHIFEFSCHFWCLPPFCMSIEIARNVILMVQITTWISLLCILVFWPAPIFRSVWRGTKAKRMWSRRGIPKVDNSNFYWNLIECATRKTKSRETGKLSHNISIVILSQMTVSARRPHCMTHSKIQMKRYTHPIPMSAREECLVLLRSIFANAIFFPSSGDSVIYADNKINVYVFREPLVVTMPDLAIRVFFPFLKIKSHEIWVFFWAKVK